MREVAGAIAEVLQDPESEAVLSSVRRRVAALTDKFPLYSWKLAPAAA
jgi:glycine/serine hydroxymethyltransferase